MNKELSKQSWQELDWEINFLKTEALKTDNFYKQRNYYVHFVRKSKREYYGNLNEKNVTDNKTFCKSVKSCLSSKTTDHSKKLVENDEVIDDTKVTKTLNSFFTEAVLNLKIPKYQTLSIVMVENESNKDIDKIAEKYKHQSSVTALKQAFPDFSFSFKPVERE